MGGGGHGVGVSYSLSLLVVLGDVRDLKQRPGANEG